ASPAVAAQRPLRSPRSRASDGRLRETASDRRSSPDPRGRSGSPAGLPSSGRRLAAQQPHDPLSGRPALLSSRVHYCICRQRSYWLTRLPSLPILSGRCRRRS
ncbi:hypothetical protein Zm00014a_038676, partial [Zea mays]